MERHEDSNNCTPTALAGLTYLNYKESETQRLFVIPLSSPSKPERLDNRVTSRTTGVRC